MLFKLQKELVLSWEKMMEIGLKFQEMQHYFQFRKYSFNPTIGVIMTLIKLQDTDSAEFKRLMQESFQFGYEKVFGKCEELILSEKDIDECLNKENSYAYVLKNNQEILGGIIVEINEKTQHNQLDFLFVSTHTQNKGIGQKIWREIENLYPDTKIWTTCTPYFDKRNIHFYVNRLEFHIVKFYNEKNPDKNWDENHPMEDQEMFEFEKIMKK